MKVCIQTPTTSATNEANQPQFVDAALRLLQMDGIRFDCNMSELASNPLNYDAYISRMYVVLDAVADQAAALGTVPEVLVCLQMELAQGGSYGTWDVARRMPASLWQAWADGANAIRLRASSRWVTTNGMPAESLRFRFWGEPGWGGVGGPQEAPIRADAYFIAREGTWDKDSDWDAYAGYESVRGFHEFAEFVVPLLEMGGHELWAPGFETETPAKFALELATAFPNGFTWFTDTYMSGTGADVYLDLSSRVSVGDVLYAREYRDKVISYRDQIVAASVAAGGPSRFELYEFGPKAAQIGQGSSRKVLNEDERGLHVKTLIEHMAGLEGNGIERVSYYRLWHGDAANDAAAFRCQLMKSDRSMWAAASKAAAAIGSGPLSTSGDPQPQYGGSWSAS